MDRPPVPVQLKLNLVLPLDDTLDTFTAARIAKVSEKTIRRWCETDIVLAFKPVGRWRVDKQSLYMRIHNSRNQAPIESSSPFQIIPPKTPETPKMS